MCWHGWPFVVFYAIVSIMNGLRMMIYRLLISLFTLVASLHAVASDDAYVAEKIRQHVLRDSSLYERLGRFVDTYPRRLSGSAMLEAGIDWIIAEMRSEGWEVATQSVKVPVWDRGEEWLRLRTPDDRVMPMLGLGGSIGTNGVLRGRIVVVSDFADLAAKAQQVRGAIVVYDVPFTDYGSTVSYRYNGASEAARYGAVAALVRSVSPYGIQTPHTGAMAYNDSLTRIPVAAITMEDAMFLRRCQDRGQVCTVDLYMEAQQKPHADSRNIIIEIKGSDAIEEVLVMGGHIDSWDVGQGAMDDAGGCFAAWHALNVLRRMGMKPRRTIRVVFWTNEENGLRGGIEYEARTRHQRHVLAIESDEGTFAPVAFQAKAGPDTMAVLREIHALLLPLGMKDLVHGDGGADISPLSAAGVPVMSLMVDSQRYFWYHHTAGDTIDKLDPADLNKCAAALAIMSWFAQEKLP